MTILSLLDKDTSATLDTFNLDELAGSEKKRTGGATGIVLAGLVPAVAVSSDWYTESMLGAFLATRALLVRQQKIEHLDLRAKKLEDMTEEETAHNINATHTTVEGVSVVQFSMPTYEENPEIASLLVQFDSLLAFFEKGLEKDAKLHNSDFDTAPTQVQEVSATEPVAPAEDVQLLNADFEPQPAVTTTEEALVAVEEPATAAVVEEVPAQ
jgi:hypothetical protein